MTPSHTSPMVKLDVARVFMKQTAVEVSHIHLDL